MPIQKKKFDPLKRDKDILNAEQEVTVVVEHGGHCRLMITTKANASIFLCNRYYRCCEFARGDGGEDTPRLHYFQLFLCDRK